MYIGSEPLRIHHRDTAVTVDDFWRWSFSDLSVPAIRAAFVRFLVASSLGLISDPPKHTGKDYDLIWIPSGGTVIRIGVREAAYVQSDDSRDCPEYLAFGVPLKTECDVHVFCAFHGAKWGSSPVDGDLSPLNMDLWDFYAFPSASMDRSNTGLGFIALPALVSLESAWSDYYGIAGAIKRAMIAE